MGGVDGVGWVVWMGLGGWCGWGWVGGVDGVGWVVWIEWGWMGSLDRMGLDG